MNDENPWRTDLERSDRPAFAIAGAIGVAVGGIFAAFVVTALVGVALGSTAVSVSPLHRFGLVFVAGAIGLAGAGSAYVTVRGLDVLEYVGLAVPSPKDLLWVLGGYIGALSLVFGAGIVLTVLRVQPETANRAALAGMDNPEILLWLVPLSFLVIAPAEELLFRGVVQGRLREAFHPWIAIPATAALFALVHYFSLTGGSGARFIAIAILFLPSLVFGFAYERTRNILVSTIIHGAYNSTLALLFYLMLQMADQPVMPA